jgi:hypothetical protein
MTRLLNVLTAPTFTASRDTDGPTVTRRGVSFSGMRPFYPERPREGYTRSRLALRGAPVWDHVHGRRPCRSVRN